MLKFYNTLYSVYIFYHYKFTFFIEGFGILGALTLQLLITTHLNLQCHNKQLFMYCDNEGWIKRLTKHSTQPMLLWDYIATDIDLEMQI